MNKRRWLLIVLLTVSMVVMVAPASAAGSTGPGYQIKNVGAQSAGKSVQLRGSQILEVTLEANPGTGYAWYVKGMDGTVLRQRGDATFAEAETELKLGATQMQTLQFVGMAKGKTTLELVYARPWEATKSDTETFSLEIEVASPAPAELSIPPVYSVEASSVESDYTLTADASQTSFSWCDEGGCPAVRNQGSCGSCWAFGTVGPLEAQILIQDGVEKDLSEQYLVSCNDDGWGCDGGWWAHDYHVDKYIAPQTAAGSVYESQFPYEAADVACSVDYDKQEKVAEWYFVESESAIASTDGIKQALVDHGPVAVAVCVNTAFQSYTDGVFNTTRPPCRTVNHAVMLVGWDDTDGAWIMRNSWGPDWGEDGYMRIAYGVNMIGYSANYVVYDNGGTTEPTPTPTNTPAPTDTPDPTDTPTPEPTATATPTSEPTTVPGDTISVSDIEMWYTVTNNNRYYVYTMVTVLDNNGIAVSGATVAVDIAAPDKTYTASGTTGTDGTVTFSLRSKYTGDFTSTVTSVSASGYTYDAASNVETSETIPVP